MIPVDSKPFKKIKTTFWLNFLLMIIFLSAYGYFFYVVKSTRENVATLTKETTILEKEELDAGQIKKDLASSVASREEIVSYFVEAGNPVPFENKIEGFGKSTNVKVSFDGLDVRKNPNRLDVSFSANGSFADVYRFLAMIESAPYEISINNVSLQQTYPQGLSLDGKKTLPNDWSLRISLSVYSISGVI